MAAHAQWGEINGGFCDQLSGLVPARPSSNTFTLLEASSYSTFYDEGYFQPFSSQESSGTGGSRPLTDFDNIYGGALHTTVSDTRENTPVHEANLATTSIQPVPSLLAFPLYDQATITTSQKEASTAKRFTCTECEATTFGRKAERDRHIKEQHQCPHRDCKGRWFTAEERRNHADEHDDKNFGHHCGSCELRGRTRRSYRRADKLKQHFVVVHGLPTKFRYSRYQCTDSSCYENASDGGQYFTCRLDLNKHMRTVHDDASSELERRNTAGPFSGRHLRARRDRQPSSTLSPSPNFVDRSGISRQDNPDSKRPFSFNPSTDGMMEICMARSSKIPRPLNDLTSDHEGSSASYGDEEDSSAQVFDRNNALVGILWDWNKKNPIFVPAPVSPVESFQQSWQKASGGKPTQASHTASAPRLCRTALPDPGNHEGFLNNHRAKRK